VRGANLSRASDERTDRRVAAFCWIVVVAAGVSAIALLVAPGSTDRYFSWTLQPDEAAAVIGGLYLASAVVFAWALTLPWRQVRPLFVGVLGLAVPTLVLTIVHDQVFDFGRWQAVAWVVLFALAPVSAAFILVTAPREPSSGSPLPTWARVGLGVVAALFAALAVTLWVDTWREDASGPSPFDLVGLTGAYIGAWCSFTAVMAGWAAVRGRWDDARVPLVTMAAVAGGLVLASARAVGL
jgi:hypothetical protein